MIMLTMQYYSKELFRFRRYKNHGEEKAKFYLKCLKDAEEFGIKETEF